MTSAQHIKKGHVKSSAAPKEVEKIEIYRRDVSLTEFEQVVHELRNAGGEIDQSESVLSMPETFQAVTTAIDIMFCQDESKVILDFFKNKLLMEESRQAEVKEESGSRDAAFLGYMKKWNKNWKGKRTQKKRKQLFFLLNVIAVVS
ncbi:hypothetical protein JTB14_020511 [Gonioctena quinquepunctata]|nr:hypothetical protein JTB14_020511 [Gonioctena quinquepunctata]